MMGAADRPGRVRYVMPPNYRANAVIAEIRRDVIREFGVVAPPVMLHTPLPAVLCGVWAALYESTLARGELPRTDRELINVAVSQANQCPYCVDIHSLSLQTLGAGQASRQLREGTPTDPRLSAIVGWAKATRDPGSALLRTPPFHGEAAVEAVGTAMAFHYLNRMVNVFLPEQPIRGLRTPFAGIVRTYTRLALFGPAARRAKPPERSLRHLGTDERNDLFAWAAAKPPVWIAYTALHRRVNDAAQWLLPHDGLARVAEVINQWDGAAPPLRRSWVNAHTADLTGAAQATARLALLSALAPYQVDPTVVAPFRTHLPSDEALLAVVAYGAWQATLRIATWTTLPLTSPSR